MAIVEREIDKGNGTSRPVPDPTALTDSLVSRAVLALRELMETRLDSVSSRVDNAVATVTRHADTAVEQNSALTEEKIRALTETVAVFKESVKELFTLNDKQTQVAFSAAKEAVAEQNKSNALSIDKSEKSTAKQIDQLSDSQRASVKNTDDKIEALKQAVEGKNADVKDRLAIIEGRATGVSQTGIFIVGAFAVLASMAAIVTLVVHFAK